MPTFSSWANLRIPGRGLRAYCPEHHRVIAVLDDQPSLIGRAIAGIPVLGSPNSLEPVLDEFAAHGIRTNRIIIGGDEGLLSPVELRS